MAPDPGGPRGLRRHDLRSALINGIEVLSYPFLPFSAEKLHRLPGHEDELLPHGWQHERLAPGTPLPEPKPLFTKLKIDP